MASIRPLQSRDVDEVVERITHQLGADATRNPLVSPTVAAAPLADALHRSTAATWVALENEAIVGHLYGALLENATHGYGVWIGPDGVSYDRPDVLSDLYAAAGQEWIDADALEHYVWVLDHSASIDPWYQLGFARVHQKGGLALDGPRHHPLPAGYDLRTGSLDDLDLAVTMTDLIDRAQEEGPSFAIHLSAGSQRGDLEETLSDPDVRYFVVEHRGDAVGQCITFPLPERRGSFAATLHLSAVVVRDDHQGRGVATAMVDAALTAARDEEFEFAETNWRVTNRRAHRYWTRYGFRPTYVRLHRTIGAG